MNDSPTPLTDEANLKWPMDRHTLAFSRQLEGRLSAAQSELAIWHSHFGANISAAIAEFDLQCKELADLKRDFGVAMEYSQHSPTCSVTVKNCDCGLDEFLARLKSTSVPLRPKFRLGTKSL